MTTPRNNLDLPQYQFDEVDSKMVFKLRKEKRLKEAYQMASALLKLDPNDEWNQRAMAWVLADLVQEQIDHNNPQKGFLILNRLIALKLEDQYLQNKIRSLQQKLSPIADKIKQASALSKNGKHIQALEMFRQLHREYPFFPVNYEDYGWAIYRYLNEMHLQLSNDEVKRTLFEYNEMKNERPGLLHSFILNFAIRYCLKNTQMIDLYRYFLSWGPENIRAEDTDSNSYQGREYPPLLQNLIKAFVHSPTIIDFNLLEAKISVYHTLSLIEIYRESVFWQLYNSEKTQQYSQLWQQYDHYATHYSQYGPSHWHSEILNSALRHMTKEHLWRFPLFLQKWGVENFRSSDWRNQVYQDKPIKSLVAKTLSHIDDYRKVAQNSQNLIWILPFYQKAIEHINDDIWLLRGYAHLLAEIGNREEAISIYHRVILHLKEQAYAWHEYSQLIRDQNQDLSLSMLCIAISKQPKEEFLGSIRLELAALLIQKSHFAEAKRELITYRDFRQAQQYKIPPLFDELYQQIESVTALSYDQKYYREMGQIAIEYLYHEIPWQTFLIYRSWKNAKNNEELMAITNLDDIEMVIKKRSFPLLKTLAVNDLFSGKTYFDPIKNRHSLLLAQASDRSYEDFIQQALSAIVIVDHINHKKALFHYYTNDEIQGIVHFHETLLKPQVGDFLSLKYFITEHHKSKEPTIQVIELTESNEINSELIKTVHGTLQLKYRNNGRTLEFDEAKEANLNTDQPDFAFIEDYYVHRNILHKYGIDSNREINAKTIKIRGKWSVIELY